MRAPGVRITDHSRAEYATDEIRLGLGATTDARSSGMAPEDSSLWARRVLLAPGGVLHWSHDHFDQVVWVRSGSLTVDGTQDVLSGEDVFVVEDGVTAGLTAQSDADVVVFGSSVKPSWAVLGPPTGPRSAYVIAGGSRSLADTEIEPGVHVSTRFWADSTRRSSRLAFLQVSGDSGHKAPNHFHTHDEIIYVVDGSITVGQATIGRDSSIFIPADQWYRYSAAGPYAFINFRPDASRIVFKAGTEGMLETVEGLAAGPAL